MGPGEVEEGRATCRGQHCQEPTGTGLVWTRNHQMLVSRQELVFAFCFPSFCCFGACLHSSSVIIKSNFTCSCGCVCVRERERELLPWVFPWCFGSSVYSVIKWNEVFSKGEKGKEGVGDV